MREPKLRKKKVGKHVYWYTEANGEAYFGKVGEVPHETAREHFRNHLGKKQEPAQTEVLTVGGLFSKFLAWVNSNRSDAQYRRRKRDCSRFARFEYAGHRLADIPALDVTGQMLEDWRTNLAAARLAEPACENDRQRRGLVLQTLLHAETSIRHGFNWGCKHPSPLALLPMTFRPFAGVERTWVPPKELTEANLLTVSEVDALLAAARYDVDQFRRWGIETHIKKHGTANMRPAKDDFPALLRVYHATGARTSELATARIRNFQPGSKQIVLTVHKRSRTQQIKTVRSITLNDVAAEIVSQRCAGRGPDEVIFITAWDKPWNKKTLNTRLRSVRRIAVAMGTPVREGVTIYDFRHLWITDALEKLSIESVAKIAGTSVAMVERVYGHFRKDRFAEAHRLVDEARRKRREPPSND